MAVFDHAKVNDPLFYAENVLPPHASGKYYASAAEQAAGTSTYAYKLDGLWKFSYAKNYASAVPGFELPEYDCMGWDDIRVPAHIQMEGYDVPHYANVAYPWDGREDVKQGRAPERFNPVASYVKYFALPAAMQNLPVHIEFEGVESGMALWLNGRYVGYTEDSFSAHAFDLTPYLQPGTNKLAVQVYKWTSSSWCEDQDFFRFSGIFRSVWLYAIPKVHLEDFSVRTLFDGDDLARADLDVRLAVRGKGSAKLTLLDGAAELFAQTLPLEKSMHLVRSLQSPKLWSAEQPALYTLTIELYDEAGVLTEYRVQKVGFRKFELKASRMLLNGKRIVFRGVNRHEFSAANGRACTREEIEQDIRTMKQNNINAIRTSHYQNQDILYDLCDEYGLYLIAENNLETHGTWDIYLNGACGMENVIPNDRAEWRPLLMARMRATYERDKNHAAVLIWSLGNESFGGEILWEMSQLVRSLDDTRLVHYEGIHNDRRYPDTSDMESQMYARAADIERYLERDGSKPFISCENSHAMGNSCGGLSRYTELADRPNSGYQGGFIWDYIDQSIYKKDRYGKWFQAFGGDFGDRPTDYNFSGNGIAYAAERVPSPKMQEVKFCYQSISIGVNPNYFTVWNKNLFLATSAYACCAVLQKNGVVVCEQLLDGIDVPPEGHKSFPLPMALPVDPGEWALTISFRLKKDTLWAKAGYEIAFGQGIIANNAAPAMAKRAAFSVVCGTHDIGVRGEHFEALFSDLAGGLTSYRYGGKELIAEIPRPNFWRAPTDNDCGNNMGGQRGQWKLASLYATTKGVGKPVPTPRGGTCYVNPVYEVTDDFVQLTYRYNLQTVPAAACTLQYRVFGSGRIEATLHYDPVDGLPAMPEFGVMFKIDADYDRLEWYGSGPAETYCDRQQGAKLGVWHNMVADNMAQYLVPQECGAKTNVRWAKVTDRKGRGLLFTAPKDRPVCFSALPYTPHEIENARHPYELPPVHYTVIRVMGAQMGIGGDDSWGAPVLPEYVPDVSRPLEFTFSFEGI